ncbi:MAG: hypothetical protein FPO08_07520 [Geobacter sp.]|nr:MAG: hypothetical protein FPO08_07520 [Geobacter sp.]
MLPITMKKPVWLVPMCILDLTIGLFLLLVVGTSWFAPDLRDKAERRGLTGLVFLIAIANVAMPTVALWYHCRVGGEESGGDQ